MQTRAILLTVVFLVSGSIVFATEKGSQSDQEQERGASLKEEIKNAMYNFISNTTCANGKECKLGDITAQFDYLHEGVKEKDGYYVSCASYMVGNDEYDADYYVKEQNGEFVVEKELLHKKNDELINKVLWHKCDKDCPDHEKKWSGYEKKGSDYEKKGSGH